MQLLSRTLRDSEKGRTVNQIELQHLRSFHSCASHPGDGICRAVISEAEKSGGQTTKGALSHLRSFHSCFDHPGDKICVQILKLSGLMLSVRPKA